MGPAGCSLSALELPASLGGPVHDDVFRGVPGLRLLPQQHPRDAFPVHLGPPLVDQKRHQTVVQFTGELYNIQAMRLVQFRLWHHFVNSRFANSRFVNHTQIALKSSNSAFRSTVPRFLWQFPLPIYSLVAHRI